MNEILDFLEGMKKIAMWVIVSALSFLFALMGMPFGENKLWESRLAEFLPFPNWMVNFPAAFFYSLVIALVATSACHKYWDFKLKHDMDNPFPWETAPKRLKFKFIILTINYIGTTLIQELLLFQWYKREKASLDPLIDVEFYTTQAYAMKLMLVIGIIGVPYINAVIGFYTAEPTFRSRNN
jgi:fluoride ion exporter CrcB/FEX